LPVIAVNTRLLLKGKLEGIGRFSFETLSRITRKHSEYQFVFLFDRPFDPDFLFSDNITPLILSPQARHPLLFMAWFEFSLPPVLNRLKPDLFLSPDGYLSLNAKGPCLPVIHDINFFHFPQHLSWVNAKYYNYFFPKFAKKASRIATVSEFSKKDIAQNYHLDSSLIDVVYNGVNEEFTPLSMDEIDRVRTKWSRGLPYFFYVGSLQPRKNIAGLIKAYNLFRKKCDLKILLLLAGQKYLWNQEMQDAFDASDFKDDIVFTGRLEDEDLFVVTASALCSTYIPFFEGFGIPVIEAMKCGVPVITSDVSSLPEVAGNAAILIQPDNLQAVADAMVKIAVDKPLAGEMAAKGMKRAADFHWDLTADKLWLSMQRVMNPLTGHENAGLC
jgi:glycosyltransferase involved in cell wall biosynthesis